MGAGSMLLLALARACGRSYFADQYSGAPGAPARTLTPVLSGEVTPEEIQVVNEAIQEYIRIFGCRNSVVVNYADLSALSARTASGQIAEIVVETSQRGQITIDSNAVRMGVAPSEYQAEFQRVALHACTHACAGERVYLPEPVRFSDELEIIAAEGMAVVARHVDGTEFMYVYIEEGFADALAGFVLGSSFISANPEYERVRHLTSALISTYLDDDYIRAAQMLQESDLLGFANAIFSPKDEEDNLTNLLWLVTIYARAQSGEDVQLILNDIPLYPEMDGQKGIGDQVKGLTGLFEPYGSIVDTVLYAK